MHAFMIYPCTHDACVHTCLHARTLTWIQPEADVPIYTSKYT